MRRNVENIIKPDDRREARENTEGVISYAFETIF